MFALSLAYSEEEERLARSVGNLGATVVLLGACGMNCGPWRTATMRIRIRRIKKQFAVRRRHGIGSQPISEEAEDLVVEFLSRGHSPEQIAAVPGQYPRPVSHAWIYSKAGSRPAPWRAVVQASALLAARGEEAAQERTWAVLSLIGSASPSAPKVLLCAAVLAIGKVTLWSVG